MTAEDALVAGSLDLDLARVLIHPIDPGQIEVKRAPRWLTRLWGRGIQAMTILNRIYVDPGFLGGHRRPLGLLVAHELIHARQWRDHGFIGFLLRYVADYLKGRRDGLGHRDAYMAVGLEVEARGLAARFRE